MASTTIFRCVVLLVVCTFSASAFRCFESPVREQCDEYFKQGGINIWLQDLKNVNDWTDEMGDKLAEAIAQVSNDYVILEVTADQHVAQASMGVQVWNDQIRIKFFVLNPSGSEVVPTAFRGPEFYLMMNLNDARIEELFGQKVKAINPTPEPLAVPIWAVAILGYVGVVVLCAMGLYATRDWRKRKQHELEESLSMSNMEKGASNGNIPMNDMHPNEKKRPLVAYAEAGVQTEKDSSGIKKAKSKEKLNEAEEEKKAPLSNGHTVKATIENGADEKHEPVPDTYHSEETTTKYTDALVTDEEHTDDSKASTSDDDDKGVDNKAFEEEEEEKQESDQEKQESDQEKQESDQENSQSSEEKEESEESAAEEKEDSDEDDKGEEAIEKNDDKSDEEEKKEDDKEDEVGDSKEDSENQEDEDGEDDDADTQF